MDSIEREILTVMRTVNAEVRPPHEIVSAMLGDLLRYYRQTSCSWRESSQWSANSCGFAGSSRLPLSCGP